jgi:predicted DNA-binding transcriptional regulator AlpA
MQRQQSESRAAELVSDGLLGLKAAEKYSGMGRSWLYEEMSAGRLAYVTLGRRRLIPRKALQSRIAAGLVEAAPC